MPHTPDVHGQANYQVRMEWGEAGLARLARSHVVIVVQTFGLTARALAAGEHARALAAAGVDAAERVALAAARDGARVVVAGIRNAAAAAAHVLDVQRSRGERTSIAVIAVGDDDAAGPRFAVEDLLGAGAVIAALGDLGIDHASPDAAVAGEGFRALRGAVRHLLTASGTGRLRSDAGERELVRAAAERDAASVVPVLRDGVFTSA